MKTINCKGKLLDLSTPKIMGILNVTPDSFFDGGRYNSMDNALFQVEKMLEEGADIIDIGGMSSRPGAEIISTEEELKRVIPIVEAITKRFEESILSIDTVKSEVAKQAIEAGGHLINDISAGQFDDKLYETVAALDVPYILMHMNGSPKTMQHDPKYDNVITHVTDFFIREVGILRELGVKDILLDVGFGFGKTIDHNYQLLKQLKDFQIIDSPILVGISRKSMIYKLLNIQPQAALSATSALHLLALQNGGNLLRVHDVKEAKEVIELWKQIYH
ncbi:MAG: dihydropteroate synthase [Cognaticolwellia sp.]|jgi:dihydropteroate synthase